jgi:transposase
MQICSVGIDLGKTTFHLVALGASGKVLVKKTFTQKQLLAFTANMQTSLIGLEACSGAHFLGKALRDQGRDFAAWLGLVPRQYSTGGKAKLLGISKRGNIYVRKVLIHGASAAAMRIKRDRFSIGTCMDALEARAPRNVLVVAMANKLARLARAVLSSCNESRPITSAPA